MSEDHKKVYVVYDGQCPFCTAYCKLVKIREAVGEIELIDAREPSALMDEITELGLNIDQGMVVKIDEQIYYGDEAIHVLAMMSTDSGFFNKFNAKVFGSKRVSSILYPVLRDCRNVALWLMRIPMIKNLEETKKGS